MINRVGILLAAASVAGLTSASWSQTLMNASVQSPEGGDSVSVSPGGTVDYRVIGVLSNDDQNEGLALVLFDLSLDGASCTGNECDLTPADEPTEMPMLNFARPLGITNPNPDNPSEGIFGGTVIGGDLIQICGGQNTIINDEGNAPFPIGGVITNLGGPPDGLVLVTGSLTAPTATGTYTLSLSNLAASVIQEGEIEDGTFWATELAEAGEITHLTIEVTSTTAACTDTPSLCDDGEECTADVCDPDDPGADVNGCVHEYEGQVYGDICLPYCPDQCPQPNLDDILCILDDFAGGAIPQGCLCDGLRMTTDLSPCPEDGGGDGTIGLDDILVMLDAFAGLSPCDDPCP